jgi:hypothetical protein
MRVALAPQGHDRHPLALSLRARALPATLYAAATGSNSASGARRQRIAELDEVDARLAGDDPRQLPSRVSR